jgi:MarR family transcriptional regulator, organic hydroperoxide resistance regulator
MTTVTDTSAPAREDAVTRLGSAYKGVMGASRRLRGRDTHRPGEPSFAQFHLLTAMSDAPLSTGELAAAAELAPATVTEMLDHLVEQGLVDRHRSERDRRVVTCSLTPRGRTLIAKRRARMEQVWAATLAEFSSQELETAAAVLDRIRAMLDELDAGAKG